MRFWRILFFYSAVSIPHLVYGQEAEVKSWAGIYNTTLETVAGTVNIYLPDGLASGDTISGTIVLEAKGNSQNEKNRARKELSEYSVELEKDKKPLTEETVKWTIPVDLVDGATFLVIRNKRGDEVDRVVVPVRAKRNALDSARNPSAREFVCPMVGRGGAPIAIHGPFDGNFSTTELKVGGKPVSIIVESPRKLVFFSPVDAVGPIQIELKERGTLVRRNFNNLRVVRINRDKVPIAPVKPVMVKSREKGKNEKKLLSAQPITQSDLPMRLLSIQGKKKTLTPFHILGRPP